MNDEQRHEIIRRLQQGEDLSIEWARILFPPEKREYELVYHGKEREEDKDDDEIADPAADNIKKHEYATDHFKRLNQWLEKEKIPTRYQFNMISPKSYNVFFQKLRDGGLVDFRSDLDVAMTEAAKAGS
jgi:hypothetical protein